MSLSYKIGDGPSFDKVFQFFLKMYVAIGESLPDCVPTAKNAALRIRSRDAADSVSVFVNEWMGMANGCRY